MDVAAYLKRIGYRGPLNPSLETLRGLHLAHMYTVPFENLDILAGRPIGLGGEQLFDKIVTRGRGGFCYELNGMFAVLLRQLGFRVTLLSAAVAREAGGYSPEFDHLALRVDLDEPRLADVVFVVLFRIPLAINDAGDLDGGGHTYCIVADGEYPILQRRDPEGWTAQYRFLLEPHTLEDFAERSRFHQSSPESHFTRGRICTLATPEGRVSLSGLRLIVTTGTERSERWLSGDAEYADVLRKTFGVLEKTASSC